MFVPLLYQKRDVMAQVQLTVNVDSQVKQQLERFCALSGMSQDSAIEEMTSMWQRLIYVPWTEFLEKEEKKRQVREWWNTMRAKAGRGETPDLSMEEIIEEIDTMRAEQREKTATL